MAQHKTPDQDQGGRLHDARDAARRAVHGAEANPLGLLVGGLAVGALAGALVPRTAREKQLLNPVGRQLKDRAVAALDAARTAGRDELDARGLTRDAAKDQVKSVLDGVAKAASTAGSAAAKSATQRA